MPGLAGRTALVTGGGRGIGRAIALDLAAAGVNVAIAARTRAEIDAVARELVLGHRDAPGALAGVKAVALQADVADPASVRTLFRDARAALGDLDILVNGAGVAPTAPLVKTTDEQWRQAIEVNLSGAFYCLREALPSMTARGWGRVVNVASIAGKTGIPYIAAYAASKHGLLGLTKVAALEVAARGVTVNAVCPSYVRTPLVEKQIADQAKAHGMSAEDVVTQIMLEPAAIKRLLEPSEVAAYVSFLCSDDASGITGATQVIDCGWTAR